MGQSFDKLVDALQRDAALRGRELSDESAAELASGLLRLADLGALEGTGNAGTGARRAPDGVPAPSPRLSPPPCPEEQAGGAEFTPRGKGVCRKTTATPPEAPNPHRTLCAVPDPPECGGAS